MEDVAGPEHRIRGGAHAGECDQDLGASARPVRSGEALTAMAVRPLCSCAWKANPPTRLASLPCPGYPCRFTGGRISVASETVLRKADRPHVDQFVDRSVYLKVFQGLRF